MTSRSMTLTPEHVSRAHRVVEDTGPEANVTLHSDADYDAMCETSLRHGRKIKRFGCLPMAPSYGSRRLTIRRHKLALHGVGIGHSALRHQGFAALGNSQA